MTKDVDECDTCGDVHPADMGCPGSMTERHTWGLGGDYGA
jgi:hypothetical protein